MPPPCPAQFLKNMIIGARNKYPRFFKLHGFHKREILLARANPCRDFGVSEAQLLTFYNRFPVLFRVQEKLSLPDYPAAVVQLVEQFINIHNLFYRVRGTRLLTVPERGVGNMIFRAGSWSTMRWLKISLGISL